MYVVLRLFGVPSRSYGSLLSSLLMNKVPQGERLIISREVKGEGLGTRLVVGNYASRIGERAAQGNPNPQPDPSL